MGSHLDITRPSPHVAHVWLARQVAYRDILALRGKLRWDDAPQASAVVASETRADYKADVLANAASTKARKKK